MHAARALAVHLKGPAWKGKSAAAAAVRLRTPRRIAAPRIEIGILPGFAWDFLLARRRIARRGRSGGAPQWGPSRTPRPATVGALALGAEAALPPLGTAASRGRPSNRLGAPWLKLALRRLGCVPPMKNRPEIPEEANWAPAASAKWGCPKNGEGRMSTDHGRPILPFPNYLEEAGAQNSAGDNPTRNPSVDRAKVLTNHIPVLCGV